MRIVQLVTQMEAGGAQRIALWLADGLRANGHSVETWFLYIKRPAFVGMPTIRALFPRAPKGPDYVRIAWILLNTLRQVRPDALITHTHYANVVGQWIGYLFGIPKRIAIQHNPVQTYPKAARFVDRWLGDYGVYTDNIAVSNTVRDSLRHYPPRYQRRMRVIYNGIPSLEVPPISKTELRRKLGLPTQAPIVVNVGRLAHQKNQGLILEALRELPDVHAVLVGDGELRSVLAQRSVNLGVHERVHFMGELPQAKAWEVLAAADLFVFPSYFEAMGLALVEALSAGLPAVASDIPAAREVMGDAGIFISPTDAGALAQAIRMVLSSPGSADAMAKKGMERAKRFSVQEMVKAYAELLSKG